jgi:hypothetical protein
MCIQLDSTGRLVSKNQVLNYLYHSETLVHMNFYEFARCVTLKTKAKAKTKGGRKSPHLGTYEHHPLKEQHPLSEMHILIEHTNDLRGDGHSHLILHFRIPKLPYN